MTVDDLPDPGIYSLAQRGAAVLKPVVIPLPVDQRRYPGLLPEMLKGVGMGQELGAGADFLDDVNCQRLLVHLYSLYDTPDMTDNLVVHHQQFQRAGSAILHVAAVMDQVGAAQRSRHDRTGGFDCRLLVNRLGVSATGGGEHGDLIVVGHVGKTGVQEIELRRSVAQDHASHVQNRRNSAHDKGRPLPDQLAYHQAGQAFGIGDDDVSGQGYRGGTAAARGGSIDARKVVASHEHRFLDRFRRVDERRTRLRI